MFSDLLKSVANHHLSSLPFVVYRKPNEVLVHAILQEDLQIHQVNDFSETGFVFAPFDSSKPAVLFPIKTKLEASYQVTHQSKLGQAEGFKVDETQKSFHFDLVKKGISQIENWNIKKVVLSRKIEAECEAHPLELFEDLLNTYTNAFCYLWYHPEIGTWLGATPEILLKANNQQFTTMSLAGTQQYVAGKAPAWGDKELEEQQLVTDYISDTLRTKISNLQISDRESIRAGSLWHLRTKLTGRIEKGSLADCIKALHPTPAVCGMP